MLGVLAEFLWTFLAIDLVYIVGCLVADYVFPHIPWMERQLEEILLAQEQFEDALREQEHTYKKGETDMGRDLVLEDWAVEFIEEAVPSGLDRDASDRLVWEMTGTMEYILSKKEVLGENTVIANTDAMVIRDDLRAWADDMGISDRRFLAGLQNAMLGVLEDILQEYRYQEEQFKTVAGGASR